MCGGVDIKAMDIPKKLFATARNFEEGGSLTVVGTALIDTGSRMDDLIFQEFKGTGNMELVSTASCPTAASGRRSTSSNPAPARRSSCSVKEDLTRVWVLRKVLTPLSPTEAMELLLSKMAKTKSNSEFLAAMASGKS